MRGGRLPVAGFFLQYFSYFKQQKSKQSLESVKKTDFTIYSFEVIDALE